MLYYCVQSSDYLRCVDILNHKITPLIRLLTIQKCPMRKQTLSQEFQPNNIKFLRKLVNITILQLYSYSSHLYILYLRAGHHDCPHFICSKNINKLLSIIETVCYTTNGYFRIPLYNFSLTLYTPTM